MLAATIGNRRVVTLDRRAQAWRRQTGALGQIEQAVRDVNGCASFDQERIGWKREFARPRHPPDVVEDRRRCQRVRPSRNGIGHVDAAESPRPRNAAPRHRPRCRR